ncbi:MAG: insulinase family protein [Bergeyella sp.]
MNLHREEKHTDKNGYEYTVVTNDSNNVRTYILKNGLKVFLAQNFDAPRIQTYIPVKTGSNNDPADNTGLAHYLEHMMFKGTSKIGSSDWSKEKPLLDEIEKLYELHKAETNPEKKKEIYRKIDEVSQEASRYAIANEYDKIISSLGATGTNAHTWLDETVYKNNIPNNELEKWLKIEKERFSELALRLFHTELESVYEEFNRAQDNDARLVNYALMELLFPKHPNGQQTTLGKAEHLKNPSMKAIYQYFDNFYVPNNYAVVLVGDFQFDETIQLVDKYFGTFEYKELPEKKKITEEPLTKIVSKTVKSPTIPRVQIAWRTDSYGSREAMLADVTANILSNKGDAGLLDLNINQQQKMLVAQAYSVGFRQYGYFSAVAVPKEDQALDEGILMILEQIDLIKKGEFPDWMIPAIISDFKIQRLKTWETADGLATTLYDTFIKGRTWEQEINEVAEYETITKEEVVDFAKKFFSDNYAAVYKERGENENLIRVENPGITPVKLNRDVQSEFFTSVLNEPSSDIHPEFIDYKKEIQTEELSGKKFSFVKNVYNDVAQVFFIFPFGTDNDKKLPLSVSVLQYLGTDRFSPQKLKKEFYKIGISHEFKITQDQLQISVSGLEQDIPKGIELLHHWLEHAQPNQDVYETYVHTILESREAARKDKTKIMNALVNYAKFGAFSRHTDVLSKQDLSEIQCEELTDKVSKLFSYDYEIFYYGNDFENFKSYAKHFITPQTENIPEAKNYPEPETAGTVFFTNYDMVQVEMSKVAKGHAVNPDNYGKINVFNEYFGRGLSSVVFQEIRESKSLAYSAYVSYQPNQRLHQPDYITTYIGTQPDKLMTAVDTMSELMSELPQIPLQFENARKSALKQIASTRIKRTNIFFNYLNLKKLGIDYDLRKNIYDEIEHLTLEKLTGFYNSAVKPLSYNTAIIGKKENLDLEAVEKMGTFREVGTEEIFGY